VTNWTPEWIAANWPTCGWLDEATATFDPNDPDCAVTGWCERHADYVAAHEQEGDEPFTEGWCAEHMALVRADPAQRVVAVETLVIEGARKPSSERAAT
jgi:hypothetical protein